MQQGSKWFGIDKELAMLRYLMISLLTALTIILLTRSLVGATQCAFNKNVGASESALSQE
jgi:hypothetical protein